MNAKLWVPTLSIFGVERDDEGDVVGEIVDVPYKLTHGDLGVWFLQGTVKVMEGPGFTGRESRIVTPVLVKDPPPRLRLEVDSYTTAVTVRTCNASGTWDVTYQAFVQSTYGAEPVSDTAGLGLPVIRMGPHYKNVNAFKEYRVITGRCSRGPIEEATEGPTETPPDDATPEPPPEPTTEATQGPTSTSTPAPEQVRTAVLILGGERYPFEQFRVAEHAEGCEDGQHYHADAEVLSLEGGSMSDPGGCGFGLVGAVEKKTVDVDEDIWAEYRNRLAGN